ncbi:MAG: type III-B CRISPR module RAMP protein Cmr6 [candidate division WOR-3 bacterium]|jgi:CRISPR-associated protein Cmr6
MEEKRFEVRGKIWWGLIKKIDSIKKDRNEEKAKEKFITENFPKEIENFSLFLNKYVPIIDAQVKDTIKNKEEVWFSIKESCIGEDSKKPFLKGLIDRFNNNNKFKQRFKKFDEIIESIKVSLTRQGYELVYSDKLQTKSRLIIGLGSSHVLETSIALHHIYGIPYIPASALKGVCRTVTFWNAVNERKGILNDKEQFEEFQKKYYGKLCPDKDILKYQLLFGAQNFKGLLLFLDAYPVIEENQQVFDLDIMSVHYQSYYKDNSGKTPPGDWENPRPIVFLTVKEGVKFKFNVLFDKFRANEILKMDNEALKKIMPDIEPEIVRDLLGEFGRGQNNLKGKIKNLLEEALREFGVGAKTKLGYGIFE